MLAGLAWVVAVPAALAQSEAAGKKLYLERGCADCHGADASRNLLGIRSGANNPGRILAACATEATMAPTCSPGAPFEVSPDDAANIAAYIANPNSRGPAARSTPGALVFQRAAGTGASPRRNVRLTNITAAVFTLSAVRVQGESLDAADYEVLPPADGASCVNGLQMAPQASCSVDVVFAPAATGTRTASLQFLPQGFDTVRVVLSGTGTTTAAPAAASDAGTLDFGAQPLNSSSARTLQVTNVGDADMRFDTKSALTLAGPQAGDYAITGGTCAAGTTVARDGGSCTVEVRFTPRDTAGGRVATLEARAQGAATSVALQGAGLDAADDRGGGCSMLEPDTPADPLLPALCAAALAVLGWRSGQHRLKHPHAEERRS